ncbi:MAG: hypothetical protein ISS34_05005 [Candidatus Omnitrophica bacterium]|nr:hypothetical protein [Candidatus Omnitrophota bacterium]
MKRAISLMVLVTFISSQSAYAQMSQPISTPTNYEIGRDKAMIDALFEAEYKQTEAEKREDRLKTLKGPMAGKRERQIIEKYRVQQEAARDLRMAELMASKVGSPEEESKLRKIRMKGRIPKNADLGGVLVRDINEKIYPFKISGEYQLAWGYDGGDVNREGDRGIWKKADWNEANLVYALDNQYVFGRDRENTYDRRIYDKFRLKIESVRETGFNVLSEIVVDPWSFVGKTDYIMVTSPGGQFPMQLRYWSNTQRTIDERIWLSSGNDFVNIPQIEVHNGSTLPQAVVSRWNNIVFDIPRMEINRDFRPLRKWELNYKEEYLKFKIFPFADHDHSYTSDDPLVLSNNHTYWEASPWLNRWDAGIYYPPAVGYRRGAWRDDIAFESRDSDFNFLTLLRGLSFELDYNDTYAGGAIGTPLTLWQDFDSINSLPGAVRIKQNLFGDYYVGTTYAFNYGFDQEYLDALNHVIGIDAGYEIPDLFNVRGEFARSTDRLDWNGHDPRMERTKSEGNAFRIEAKGDFMKDVTGEPTLKVQTDYTFMDTGFRARLSNYRNTRKDEFWGKHINFNPVSPNFDPFRIGNGVDTGRNVYHIRLENILFAEKFTSLFDARFVRGSDGSKIENVYREEFTMKPIGNLVGKFLFRYQDLPETQLNVDPYILEDYISSDNTGDYVVNDDIAEGEDADVWTCSFGLHYDPINWLGLEGIYERTNDYEVFPQLTLNDAGFRNIGDIRELNHFIYNQPLIAIPPYDDYDIFKARIYYTPMDSVRIKLEYVLNEFKHATGRDDNISHYGVEADFDITENLRTSFKFTRSQVVDLFMQSERNTDVPFNHHNNIFAQMEYDFFEDHTFVVQFGEFFIPTKYSAVHWMLNTIDTQRIVRIYLKGRF